MCHMSTQIQYLSLSTLYFTFIYVGETYKKRCGWIIQINADVALVITQSRHAATLCVHSLWTEIVLFSC